MSLCLVNLSLTSLWLYVPTSSGYACSKSRVISCFNMAIDSNTSQRLCHAQQSNALRSFSVLANSRRPWRFEFCFPATLFLVADAMALQMYAQIRRHSMKIIPFFLLKVIPITLKSTPEAKLPAMSSPAVPWPGQTMKRMRQPKRTYSIMFTLGCYPCSSTCYAYLHRTAEVWTG